MPRFNLTDLGDGQFSSEVAGHTAIYPATCNGRVADLGFVVGKWSSDFVHFGADGEPYGTPMPKKVAQRFRKMRDLHLAEKGKP